MATYIMVDGEAYETNTDAQVQAARAALAEAGLVWAHEYAGVPDGQGDSYQNGNMLFAEPSPAVQGR